MTPGLRDMKFLRLCHETVNGVNEFTMESPCAMDNPAIIRRYSPSNASFDKINY